MVTEGRVRALEDELKVVKNEIQATLLDIQKEILAHYYSSDQTSGSSRNLGDRVQLDGNNRAQFASDTPEGRNPPRIESPSERRTEPSPAASNIRIERGTQGIKGSQGIGVPP